MPERRRGGLKVAGILVGAVLVTAAVILVRYAGWTPGSPHQEAQAVGRPAFTRTARWPS